MTGEFDLPDQLERLLPDLGHLTPAEVDGLREVCDAAQDHLDTVISDPGVRVIVMTRRPGRIKQVFTLPRDAAWRGLEIEAAGDHADFVAARREIWELIRAELAPA